VPCRVVRVVRVVFCVSSRTTARSSSRYAGLTRSGSAKMSDGRPCTVGAGQSGFEVAIDEFCPIILTTLVGV